MGITVQESDGSMVNQEQRINVSAEDLIEELMGHINQLTMELAAKNVVIRKLEERLNKEG